MSIQIGEKVPNVTLKRIGPNGLEVIQTGEYFAGRKVVLFAVPGAFTPTCSNTHLPGYIENAQSIKATGVDEITCLALNDQFVMAAWAEAHNAGEAVTMLPDGNGAFLGAMGLTQDLAVAGLGARSKRFSMVINDGVVESLDIEPGPGVTVSGAAACMAKL